MSERKLPESEVKVMDFIWEQGRTTAKECAAYMETNFGWKKNTTYTVLKNLNEKGVIKREEPNFQCIPLIEREQIGRSEAKNILNRFYKGSPAAMFSAFLDDKDISDKELDELRKLLNK